MSSIDFTQCPTSTCGIIVLGWVQGHWGATGTFPLHELGWRNSSVYLISSLLEGSSCDTSEFNVTLHSLYRN